MPIGIGYGLLLAGVAGIFDARAGFAILAIVGAVLCAGILH